MGPLPRARTTRGRSIYAVTCVLGVAALLSAPALCAAEPSIEIAANEVYLDTRTGHLSGRMRMGFDNEDINQVAVVAPENSQVTLSYWPREGVACRKPPRDVRVETRSGAPTGAVVLRNGVREQKFVVKVGPLTTGKPYCFTYVIESLTPLSTTDAKRVDAALDATVEMLASALEDPSGSNACSPGPGPSPGAPAVPRPEQDGGKGCLAQATDRARCACVLGKPTISAPEFAQLFQCRLGWPYSDWVVVHPVTEKPARIRDGVRQYVESDPGLQVALDQAWQSRSNSASKRSAILSGLCAPKDSLQAVIQLFPSGKDVLEYDPLPKLDAAKLQPSLRDPGLTKTFAAVPADRAAFLHALWQNRAALLDRAKRSALAEGEAELEAFLKNKVESKTVRLARKDVAAVKDELAAGIDDVKRRKAALDKAPSLPAHSELTQYVGIHAAPDGPALLAASGLLNGVVKRLRDDVEGLERDVLMATTVVQGNAGYQNLKERVRAVTRPSGGQSFRAKPSYEERLPFWVTADVGVALGFFASDPNDDAEVGASMSFGLNFYLAELDKSEPLHFSQWSARDWGRRFAITAGFTLTEPTGVDGFGLGGVIGDRLLFTGAGLRLTDYVRLSGGALYYTQEDPSPLSDERTIKLAPYISASLDVDIIGTIQDWASDAGDVAP